MSCAFTWQLIMVNNEKLITITLLNVFMIEKIIGFVIIVDER
jgi:hypothetical protein